MFEGDFTNDDIGKIVVSTGEYYNVDKSTKASINESLPIVKLSNKAKDKAAFGVLTDKEENNSNERRYQQGVFVSIFEIVLVRPEPMHFPGKKCNPKTSRRWGPW